MLGWNSEIEREEGRGKAKKGAKMGERLVSSVFVDERPF